MPLKSVPLEERAFIGRSYGLSRLDGFEAWDNAGGVCGVLNSSLREGFY